MKQVAILVLALSCAGAMAQAKTSTTTPPPAPQAGTVQPALPQLSELEHYKVENLQLKFQALQQQIGLIQSQYRELGNEIAKAHPGYVLDDKGGLIPAPKPVSKPAAPAAEKK